MPNLSSSPDPDDDDMVDCHPSDSGTSTGSIEAMSVASALEPIRKTAADDEMELVDIEPSDVQAGDSNSPAQVREPPQDRLSNLPAEIKDLVLKDLDLLDKLDLRHTNRYFSEYIPAYTHADYLEAEKLERAVARKFYTCCMCCRLRPKAKFADKSRMNGKGRGGKKAAWRYCLDCGLQQNFNSHAKLPPNTWVTIDKIRHVVCSRCGRLEKAHKGHGTSFCEDCWLHDVQPRLEAHANPVIPNPATVADMHDVGETWISSYSTPYDVVQSAIRVGISAPSILATHQKWDLNGKELVIDGKSDTEAKDLTWKQVSEDQDSAYSKATTKLPDVKEKVLDWKQTSMDQGLTYKKASANIASGRNGQYYIFKQEFANRSTDPKQAQQKVLGPAAAFNRPVTRVYRPTNQNEANRAAPTNSVPTSADIQVGAAGPGPSTVSNSAKSLSSSGPVLSAEEKQRLAIPHYQDDADMEMKPGCALKISLPVRSFSTKPAPPKYEGSENSGNIIARNYFKASQALHNKDPKGRLGWYNITKTQALTTAADSRNLREKDLTTFQIHSVHSGKRKARDISTLDATVYNRALSFHDRKQKCCTESDSEEEWNGFSDHSSPSPESSNRADVEELGAKALATIPANPTSYKKRKNRGPEPSVIPIRPDSRAPYKREKRRRIDESSEEEWEGLPISEQPSPEPITRTALEEIRAKALATRGSKSKESTTNSKQRKIFNASEPASSERIHEDEDDDDDEWDGLPDSKQPSPEPATRTSIEEMRVKAPATQGSKSKESNTSSKQRKAFNASTVASSENFDDDDGWQGFPDPKQPTPEPVKTITPADLRIKALATQGSNKESTTHPKQRKASNASKAARSDSLDGGDDEWQGFPDSRQPTPEPVEETITPSDLRNKALATQDSNDNPEPITNPKKRKATAPPAAAASRKSAWAHFHIPLVENLQKKRRVKEDSDDSFEGFGPDLGKVESVFEGFDTSDTELSSDMEAESKELEGKKDVLRAKALATLRRKGKKVM